MFSFRNQSLLLQRGLLISLDQTKLWLLNEVKYHLRFRDSATQCLAKCNTAIMLGLLMQFFLSLMMKRGNGETQSDLPDHVVEAMWLVDLPVLWAFPVQTVMTHVVLLWHTDALHPGLRPSLLRFVEALLSFKSPPSYPEGPILRLVCRG